MGPRGRDSSSWAHVSPRRASALGAEIRSYVYANGVLRRAPGVPVSRRPDPRLLVPGRGVVGAHLGRGHEVAARRHALVDAAGDVRAYERRVAPVRGDDGLATRVDGAQIRLAVAVRIRPVPEVGPRLAGVEPDVREADRPHVLRLLPEQDFAGEPDDVGVADVARTDRPREVAQEQALELGRAREAVDAEGAEAGLRLQAVRVLVRGRVCVL